MGLRATALAWTNAAARMASATPIFRGRVRAVGVMAAALITTQVACADAGDAARGRELYESRCIACHSLDANRVGPMHRGVFGRRAGSVKDYAYSDALAHSHITWNEKTLDEWLADPESVAPGQKMGYAVSDPKDRADIIAYLREESAEAPGK